MSDDRELIVELSTILDEMDATLSALRQDIQAYIDSDDEQERMDIIAHLHGDKEPITDDDIENETHKGGFDVDNDLTDDDASA